MPYIVTARKRAGFPTRRRSGLVFSSATGIILSDDQMTPEILADAVLIVERVASPTETEPENPAVPAKPKRAKKAEG